jgi:predicted small integral membrane protein
VIAAAVRHRDWIAFAMEVAASLAVIFLLYVLAALWHARRAAHRRLGALTRGGRTPPESLIVKLPDDAWSTPRPGREWRTDPTPPRMGGTDR